MSQKQRAPWQTQFTENTFTTTTRSSVTKWPHVTEYPERWPIIGGYLEREVAKKQATIHRKVDDGSLQAAHNLGHWLYSYFVSTPFSVLVAGLSLAVSRAGIGLSPRRKALASVSFFSGCTCDSHSLQAFPRKCVWCSQGSHIPRSASGSTTPPVAGILLLLACVPGSRCRQCGLDVKISMFCTPLHRLLLLVGSRVSLASTLFFQASTKNFVLPGIYKTLATISNSRPNL